MNSTAHHTTAPALSFALDDQQLRVFTVDGEPWFLAVDVCASLGISNARHAVSRLDDDEKGVVSNDTLGGRQQVSVVNESGLYALVLTSRKPEAKRFRRWVTGEVLPSIRKTGAYATTRQVPPDRQLRLCQSLMVQIGRAVDPFCRQGLVALARKAFTDAGMALPDEALLRPLPKQMDLPLGSA